MKREDLKHWNNEKYWVNYQTNIETMINRMYSKNVDKELIIPEYQRDYVWKEKNAPELLLSLYKGFPIGNIVLWENLNNSSLSLIDGLQRYLTILKLSEKPFNYINLELYKFWLTKNNLKLFDYEVKEESEAEAFRHFKSSMHHKNKDYKPSYYDDAKKFIETTKAKPFANPKMKKRFESFIKDFNDWHKNEFKNINIPHYILDSMDSNEVSKVFELINITGTKLSRFEIASANWSQYKINLNEEIEYIKNFNKNREKKYKENFVNQDVVGSHLIKYGNKNIIPSNFLYSIFYEVFKEDIELKPTFLDKNKDYTVQTKAIEPLCEVVIHILIKKFGINEDQMSFDNLGEQLQSKIKTKEDVNNLKKWFKEPFTKIKNSIYIIKKAKLNGKMSYPSYPAWLIATFAIHIIKGSKKDNFTNWFIKELLFDKRFNSSTGNTAREIIKKLEFSKKPAFNMKQSFNELFNSEKFINSNYSDRDKSVVLSILQQDKRSVSSEEEIDHFIPRSQIEEYVDEVNNIWNLQYLDSGKNNYKDANLIPEQWKYDVFEKTYKDKQKREIEKYCTNIINELKKEEKNKEIINENYNKILEIRMKVIKEESEIFKQDN